MKIAHKTASGLDQKSATAATAQKPHTNIVADSRWLGSSVVLLINTVRSVVSVRRSPLSQSGNRGLDFGVTNGFDPITTMAGAWRSAFKKLSSMDFRKKPENPKKSEF